MNPLGSLDPGRVLDVALGILLLEGAALAWRRPRLTPITLSFLGAGAALLGAARAALGGATLALYALLALGGVLQAWHLRRLWRSELLSHR